MERAAHIIEMSEADEAQRLIQPRQPNEREKEAELLKLQNKEARDTEWREKTLPALQKAWREASIRNATNPSTKVLLIRASIADRISPVYWDEFYADRTPAWAQTTTPFLSMLTAQFTRLTNAVLGKLRPTHSQIVT